jgi:hypothetical protein
LSLITRVKYKTLPFTHTGKVLSVSSTSHTHDIKLYPQTQVVSAPSC